MKNLDSQNVVYPWNNDTFGVVLGFLSTYDMLRVGSVAKQWRAWVESEDGWRECNAQAHCIWPQSTPYSSSWMRRGVKTLHLLLPVHKKMQPLMAATHRHSWLSDTIKEFPLAERLRIVSHGRNVPVGVSLGLLHRRRALQVRGEWTVMEDDGSSGVDIACLESVILRAAKAYDGTPCLPSVILRWSVFARALIYAPQLRELHLRCHFALNNARISELFQDASSWGELHSLTLEEIDVEDNTTLGLLCALPGLTSLKLDVASNSQHTALAFCSKFSPFPRLVSLELSSLYASAWLLEQVASIRSLETFIVQNIRISRRVCGNANESLHTRWDHAWDRTMLRNHLRELRLLVDHQIETQHLSTLGSGWKYLHTLRLHWDSGLEPSARWFDSTTPDSRTSDVVSTMLVELLSNVHTLTDLGLSGVHHVEMQVIRALMTMESEAKKKEGGGGGAIATYATLKTLNMECSRISIPLMQAVAMSRCCNQISTFELTDLMDNSEFFQLASTQWMWSLFPRLRRLDLEVVGGDDKYHLTSGMWFAMLEHTRGLRELNCAGHISFPPKLLEQLCMRHEDEALLDLNLLRTPQQMAARFVRFLLDSACTDNFHPPNVVRLPYSSMHNWQQEVHQYNCSSGREITWY